MTILSVVQDVALKTGLERPTAVYSATTRDMLEMQSLIDQVANEIYECSGWQALARVHTITGDGNADEFDLPDDYGRMDVRADMWSSRWIWAITHISSRNTWLEGEVVPYTNVTGEWIIYGDQFHFRPTMASGETVKFFYISNLIVSPAAGANKAAFSADGDTFRLSERLLTLGLIWRWKQKKGQSYAEEMEDYQDLKDYLMKTDGGSQPVVGGPARPRRGTNWAFPQTVGN